MNKVFKERKKNIKNKKEKPIKNMNFSITEIRKKF